MKISSPCIIVNTKAYAQGLGAGAVRFARICAEVARQYKVSIGICVQPTDVYRVASLVTLPVFSQHVDPLGVGKHTGWLIGEGVKHAKGSGSLVNHSEHPVSASLIKKSVSCLKKLGLTSVVCASGVAQVKTMANYKPDFIAYEPTELIGGKTSVSSVHPRVIKSCATAIGKKSKLLVGAGVHTREDVSVALSLGAKGVLVASDIVLAKNPRKELVDLVKGLK